MLHLRRYFAALAVLSLLCGTYWLAAAPWVAAPKLGAPRPAAPAVPVASSPLAKDELTRLFAANSWELNPTTKIVETDQCTLLIQDYLPTPDGLLKLTPCTLIFYAKTAAGRRPIVLQAPAGALLEFDRALDVTKVSFGRLLGGKLIGEIRIFSPPSSEGARDALLMTTRDVHLGGDEIVSNYPIDFQFGDSRGRGSELKIVLQHAEAGLDGKKKRGALGGIQSLTLNKLEFARIETAGDGLLGEALPGQKKSAQSAPLEVKCRGPFTFDVPAQVARFEYQVEVERILPGSPPDKLTCDELLLTFLLRAPENAEGTTPAAKPADPMAGRLRRIVALGTPATLEAPSSGVSAKAAWMEYELARRRITLRPDNPQTKPQRVTQVSLRQYEQQFTARELQYEMPERSVADGGLRSRLGTMWAAGPGEIKLLQGRGAARQTVTARWEKELWVRPQDRNQVISLVSAASIVADPLGRFDADELHLWVREVPAEPPPAEQPPQSEQPAGKQPRTTLIPDRMLAKGNVRLASPQLDAQTGELQAWFMHLPTGPEQQSPRPLVPEAPLREPVARVGFQQVVPAGAPAGAIRNVIRPPNLQKFRVIGGRIQMQLAVQGRQFDLEDLTIEHQATIDETRTPEPGQEPIHVAGDLLKLRHGTTPQAKVEVSGQPAEVAGRGVSLRANMINVHRGENRLWIDGPGEATLPVPAGQSLEIVPGSDRRPPVPPNVAVTKPAEKLHLEWQKKLDFDGTLIQIEGDVHGRTRLQTVAAQRLEATLSERLDFQAPTSREQPELKRIRLSGPSGVYLTNRGENEFGEQVSFDQAQFPNLTIDLDRAAGTLHADGPGWVSTVRRTAGLPGAPPAAGASAAPAPIAQPAYPPVPTNQQPLTSIHISYQRALVGRLDKREVEFQREVRTTYSPASAFTDRVVIVTAADMTDKSMLMTSDRLIATEMVTPVQRWIEMQATGRTILEGQTVTVNTPGRLSYSSATEFVTIEGDGRADALIYLRSAPGEQVSPQTIRSARYNIRTGQFDGEVKRLEFFVPAGKGVKLPGR